MRTLPGRALIAPLVALAIVACDATEALLHDPAPLYQGAGAIQFSLASSSGLGAGEWDLADSIAVSVWRGASLVLDTAVAKGATTTVRLDIELPLTAEVESFDIVVEARQGVVSVLRAFADVQVIADHMSDVTANLIPVQSAIDSDGGTTCGLDATGAAYCWGVNSAGQLGDGSAPWVGVANPRQVPTAMRFRDVGTGEQRSCGIEADGSGAFCWGLNNAGQLGVGFESTAWPSAVPAPTAVVGGANLVRVSVGGNWDTFSHFACGLDAAGSAYCWGFNAFGQLGNGTTASSMTPVAVTQPVPFRTIDAGSNSVCAIGIDDRAYCWGRNGSGQVGNGTTTDALVPAQVAGLPLVDVRASNEFACGLTATGEAWCWGRNDAGVLGNGTWTSSSTPGRVQIDEALRFVDTGSSSACGVTRSNTVFCWGDNFFGQTGIGTTVDGNNPLPLANGLTDVATIDVGNTAACAIAFTGAASCWGAEQQGQLGSGTMGFRSAPGAVAGLSGTWTDVAPGEVHVCGLQTSGAAWCWGAGFNGNLGDGVFHPFVQPSGPVAVTGGHVFASITTGREYTCGLTTTGAAYCWGMNNNGELGDGSTTSASSPVAVAGGHTFTALESGYAHACAIDDAGNGWCWGRGDRGQLGNGSSASSSTPVQVSTIGNLVDIRPGSSHTCATTATGAGYCWGDNTSGQLGIGTSGGSMSAPQQVAGTWSEVHAAPRINMSEFSCGLDSGGNAYCWGSTTGCMLGNHDCSGALFTSPNAVIASGVTFASLDLGNWAQCGLTSAGARYCWGNNMQGQMGVAHTGRPVDDINGSTDPGMGAPVLTDGNAYVVVETLNNTGCGVTTAGGIVCWGDANHGLFGLSDFAYHSAPQAVTGGIVFGPGTGL